MRASPRRLLLAAFGGVLAAVVAFAFVMPSPAAVPATGSAGPPIAGDAQAAPPQPTNPVPPTATTAGPTATPSTSATTLQATTPSTSATTLPATTPSTSAATLPATTTPNPPETSTSATGNSGSFPRWVAGHESGDLSEWTRVSVSGDADARVSEEVVHSGRFANALTIRDADGGSTSPGVRMAVEEVVPVSDQDPENLPTEAFYSVYYYFPHVVDSTWWNIYQWKQADLRADGSQPRNPVYTINPELRSDGSMYVKLRSKVGANGEYVQPGSTSAMSNVALPIQTWVHLECFYRWSQAPDGRITCWQDGVLLWDVTGVVTEFDLPYNSHPRQWTVNNYANDTTPSTHTIYIDDAAISPTRIGPGS
jgi:hypothetical protein